MVKLQQGAVGPLIIICHYLLLYGECTSSEINHTTLHCHNHKGSMQQVKQGKGIIHIGEIRKENKCNLYLPLSNQVSDYKKVDL